MFGSFGEWHSGLLGVRQAVRSWRRRPVALSGGVTGSGATGSKCQPGHVGLKRVTGALCALLRRQDPIGVNLSLEAGQEGRRSGLGARAALRVQCVRRGAGSQSAFGGGQQRTAPRNERVPRSCGSGPKRVPFWRSIYPARRGVGDNSSTPCLGRAHPVAHQSGQVRSSITAVATAEEIFKPPARFAFGLPIRQLVFMEVWIDVQDPGIEALRSTASRANDRHREVVWPEPECSIGAGERIVRSHLVPSGVAVASGHEVAVCLRSIRDAPHSGIVPLPAVAEKQPAHTRRDRKTVAEHPPGTRQDGATGRLPAFDTATRRLMRRERHSRSAGLVYALRARSSAMLAP